MDQNQPTNSSQFGSVQNDPESFRNVPQASESFGKIPNSSEAFRTILKASERKENHTLTVREASRMFEAAGVARTERSIINWCQPNKMGIPRLDSYFDPNERRYFISPQSVELAIKEEQAKAARISESTEPVGSIPNHSEMSADPPSPKEHIHAGMGLKTLEREVRDLKITNQAKDYYIEQLVKEREKFVERLMISSHRVGELETKLLQLERPVQNTGLQAGVPNRFPEAE